MRLRGELLRKGLPTGAVFCVQAAIRLPALPLLGAWWSEGWGRRCWLTEYFAAQPPDRLGLGEHLSPRYSENATSNRNLGRKPKQFAVWKSGLTPLPGMGGQMALGACLDRKEDSHGSVRCLETTGRDNWVFLQVCQSSFQFPLLAILTSMRGLEELTGLFPP